MTVAAAGDRKLPLRFFKKEILVAHVLGVPALPHAQNDGLGNKIDSTIAVGHVESSRMEAGESQFVLNRCGVLFRVWGKGH